VAVDDPDLEVLDEQGDAGAGVESADADVVHSAVVPQGDGAGLVDAVVKPPDGNRPIPASRAPAPVRPAVAPGTLAHLKRIQR
jgi:hypothetical protein